MSIPLPEWQCATVEFASGAAGNALTLTIPGIAGRRHLIWAINIVRATNTAEPTGTPLGITTTNLPDSLSWIVGAAVAVGSQIVDVNETYSVPIISLASGTNTTIAMPDPGTNPIWAAHVVYSLIPDIP